MVAAMASSMTLVSKLGHSSSQISLDNTLFQTSATTMNGALLETIKFPRMLRQLSNVLPQSNYESKGSKLKQAG